MTVDINKAKHDVEAGKWDLDCEASEIAFRTRYGFVIPVRGRFTKWSAQVEVDEKNIEQSSVSVEIDTASISTGVAVRDKHLRTGHFFGVRQFPVIRFQSFRCTLLAPDVLVLDGNLTIRGVTREIRLEAERVTDGSNYQYWSARSRLDRYEYGVTMSQVAEGFGKMVGNDIDFELTATFVRRQLGAGDRR